MASFDHLHQETKILPVVDHTDLLCAQFLATLEATAAARFKVEVPGPYEQKCTHGVFTNQFPGKMESFLERILK